MTSKSSSCPCALFGEPRAIAPARGRAKPLKQICIEPEFAQSAERYLSSEGGKAWMKQIRERSLQQARIAITPEWVGLLDFKTRFSGTLAE